MRFIRHTFAKRGNTGQDRDLDEAIAIWRAAEPARERLSGATRTRILANARERTPGRSRVLAPLFLPAGRLALGAALPIVALTLLLGTLMRPGVEFNGFPDPAHAPRVEATKASGEVLFVIANGNSRHRVTRSSVPNGAAESMFTTAEGSFRVKIDDGSDVVFYRID